jgi:hypothetical protein
MSSPGYGIPNRRCGNCVFSYVPREVPYLDQQWTRLALTRRPPFCCLPFCLSSVRAARPDILGLTFWA